MNLAEINDCLNPHAICKNALVSRIFKILEACEYSKNLMIGIYLIEKDYFLFCNRLFKENVGKNYPCLWKDGWDFWFSLVHKIEVPILKNRVSNFFMIPYSQKPLILRYHITDFYGAEKYLRHEILIRKLEDCTIAINYFFDVSDKEKIEQCFMNHQVHDMAYSSKKENCIISSREKEVLHLIGEGYSSKQIADMLFISNHTAISHRKNLIEKFQVKNTAQLIKRASKVIEL